LCRETSSLDSDADVEVGELVFTEDEDGFEGLEAKTFRLDVFDGLAVDLDETTALLGECAGGGGLFPEMGVGKNSEEAANTKENKPITRSMYLLSKHLNRLSFRHLEINYLLVVNN
jgi:hypothetical protein